MLSPRSFGRPCALISSCLFVLAYTALGQAPDETQALRLRWIPGRTYIQETTTDTTTALTAIGQAQDQKMKVLQTTRVDVKGKEDGEKEARVKFISLVGEMELRGEKLTYDSANPAAASPVLQKSLGQSVGASFVLVYDKDDQFIQAKDSGTMAPTEDGTPTLLGIVESKEVAELYRRSLEMGLPKTRVKPGDRWTSQETVKFPSAGTVNVELRAKFDAIVDYDGRRHAKVSFEGDMKAAGPAEGRVAIGPGSTTFGQILFDLERETVSFAAFRADIGLQLDGKRIPVRQQVTTKLVSLEPTPAKK